MGVASLNPFTAHADPALRPDRRRVGPPPPSAAAARAERPPAGRPPADGRGGPLGPPRRGRLDHPPGRFGPWTADRRFNTYRKDGTWDRVVDRLHRAAALDHAQRNVDGTVIRAARPAAGAEKKAVPGEPGDHALGRSRGGRGAQAHLVCDAAENPLGVLLTGRQEQEAAHVERVLATVPAGLGPPKAVAGGKGGSAHRVRADLAKRGIGDVVAHRKDDSARAAVPPAFDRGKYRGRNVVERLNGWLKGRRRLATRSEKPAVNFRAMFQLAFALWYLTG